MWTNANECNRPIQHLRNVCLPKQGGRTVSFPISANRLEVAENVNRAHFRISWLVVKWCNEQSYLFRQSHKWAKADRAQYVWSSCGPITIVLMTLLVWLDTRCPLASGEPPFQLSIVFFIAIIIDRQSGGCNCTGVNVGKHSPFGREDWKGRKGQRDGEKEREREVGGR